MLAAKEVFDAVVVGGGLAGLSSAAILALSPAKPKVLVVEQRSDLGGRGSSHIQEGFTFNQGPHAIYRGGPAAALFMRLGIPLTGSAPTNDYNIFYKGKLGAMPVPPGLFSASWLGLGAKMEMLGLLWSLATIKPDRFEGLSVNEWIDSNFKSAEAKDFVRAVVRLVSYVNAPDQFSAGAFIRQLKAGTKGVLYLNRGWGSIVAELERICRDNGVQIIQGAAVESVQATRELVMVKTSGGRTHFARQAILTTSPAVASKLLPHSAHLKTCAELFKPARAACLDLALTGLPVEKTKFALGLDEPLYFSAHSYWAELAPKGKVLAHALYYLPEGIAPETALQKIENLMDTIQPGWREKVVTSRFLPGMVVTNRIHQKGMNRYRFTEQIPDVPNVFVAADWSAPDHMLLDASIASAERAAAAALAVSGAPEYSQAVAIEPNYGVVGTGVMTGLEPLS